jgi:acyl-coenzyme A synthetase/AMP-(fatty) acid ligase
VARGVARGRSVARIDALGVPGETQGVARGEDGLLIIFTSGTTGLPRRL